MSVVPDIHDVLHWSNRTLVAEEITRRGFRVSKETLNRWVRQRKEVPAAVERIVFEMFGINEQQETPPPWARELQQRVDAIYERQTEIASNASQQVIEALADPERLAWVERMAAEIRDVSASQSSEGSDDPPAAEDPGTAGPGGQGLGSSLARPAEG